MTESNDPHDRESPSPYLVMHDMMSGLFITQALHVVAQLGVADLLRDGPKTAAELSRASGGNARALYRVLRFLASKGVFTEDAAGRFATTPLGQTFETGALGSLREMVLTMCHDDYWGAVGKLPAAVRSGGSGFKEIWGEDFYAHLMANPEKARVFQRGMAGVSAPNAVALVEAHDFSGVRRLVDVGGGSGAFLQQILAANTSARGTLFDRPHVVEGARRILSEDAAVRDRIDYEGGDFFVSVPGGADAYLLGNVLHNWSDEQSIAILGKIRAGIATGGSLFVVEPVIGPASPPGCAEQLDVIMLAVFGERCGERTQAEHARLLEAAGFRFVRLAPTRCTTTLIEATPI